MNLFRRPAECSKPVPQLLQAPPKPASTAVLNAGQVALLHPAVNALIHAPISLQTTAQLYDTLRNSVITPPAPWPQQLYRFDHLVSLPTKENEVSVLFVFYSL
jgi:hypothetical protein